MKNSHLGIEIENGFTFKLQNFVCIETIGVLVFKTQ